MGPKCLWVLAILLLLFGGCDGCWKEERLALLQLKTFFNNSHVLEDWVQGDENVSNCCKWENVVCNATSGRIIALDLSNTRDDRLLNDYWYLNVSLFIPFQELKNLSLMYNQIAGYIENEGFEKLSSKLNNLKMLNLRYNYFNNSILSSLAGISSLKYLYLGFNNFNGSEDINGFQQLSKLSNLEALDLSSCNLNNSILSTLARFSSSLKSLSLYSNQFKGSLSLDELDSLINLEKLVLVKNSIEKFVATRRGSRKLQELYLSGLDNGEDTNILLESLSLFPSLRILAIYGGVFNTSTSWTQEILINLKELRIFGMHNTYLESSFFRVIEGLTSLKLLRVMNYIFTGSLPIKGGLCELTNLEELYLLSNDLTGILPSCLVNLTSLQRVDLGYNYFIGDITQSPLKSLTSLQYISLSNNHFQIPISFDPFFNHSKLKEFYGDNNEIYVDTNLHLSVPKFQLSTFYLSCCGHVGSFPQFLQHQYDLKLVDLSHIHFMGEFPQWLLENNTKLNSLWLVNSSLSGLFKLPSHSHKTLSELDVSQNFFDGQIPMEIGAHLPSLSSLYMSECTFQGAIPSSLGYMNSLISLDLSNNTLTGQVPDALSKCTKLFQINLSHNQLSGGIPRWMGNLSSLEKIMMSNNQLQDPIPKEFCQLHNLRVLDLLGNNISGSLPFCFSPPNINHVHLSNNNLQGSLTTQFYDSLSLVTLDLSNNQFTGYIPKSIERLSKLSYLLLNNNRFTGDILVHLCRLSRLSVIRLSQNDLFGQIPSCLNITTFREAGYKEFAMTRMTRMTRGQVGSTEEPIQITTKRMSYPYKGRILTLMSGIDLSCNKLIGDIPPEIGNLVKIHLLNLSHNKLTGKIPPTFSNLKEIESLDLSYNNLSGTIPPQLDGLSSLSVFNVSYNNLSGKVPKWTQQFSTFDESSYKGNPLLCGDPLPSCFRDVPNSLTPRPLIDNNKKEDGLLDMETLTVSFSMAYVMVLLVIGVVLYINPYWRRAWFYNIEVGITSCYYFALDNLIPKSFGCGN